MGGRSVSLSLSVSLSNESENGVSYEEAYIENIGAKKAPQNPSLLEPQLAPKENPECGRGLCRQRWFILSPAWIGCHTRPWGRGCSEDRRCLTLYSVNSSEWAGGSGTGCWSQNQVIRAGLGIPDPSKGGHLAQTSLQLQVEREHRPPGLQAAQPVERSNQEHKWC